MFQRKSCCLDGVDMGAIALSDVLVYALGMGNKSRRITAGFDFLADSEARGLGRPDALDRIWSALGCGSAYECFFAFVSAGVGAMGMVSAIKKRKGISWRRGPGFGFLCSGHRAVAGAELRNIRQADF